MNTAERIQKALDLYNWEADPIEPGSNAGSRKEGNWFKKEMTELLLPADPDHGIRLVTTTGKSTDGIKIDGNVSLERQTFKMLQFKMDPFMQDSLMILAINRAFVKYENTQLMALLAQAAWLNALDRRAQIKILATPQDYKNYCCLVFGPGDGA